MRLTAFMAASIAFAALVLLPLARAGGDHDHDHGDAAPAVSGPALPRFAAVSELFELVGVLKGKQITLYLDRAADNAPVTDALIELDIGGTKVKAEKREDVYEVALAAVPKPGVLPITVTVTAGQEVDLLAGELDIHEAGNAAEAAHVHSWKEHATWSAAALAGLIVVIFVARRIATSRQRRFGAVA